MIQMSSFSAIHVSTEQHVHHVITLLGCMFVALRHLKCHKKILASSAILFQYVMLETYTKDFAWKRNSMDWNGGWGVWNSKLKDSSQVICPSFQGTFLCPKSIRRTTNQLPAQKKKSCPRLTQLQHKIWSRVKFLTHPIVSSSNLQFLKQHLNKHSKMIGNAA